MPQAKVRIGGQWVPLGISSSDVDSQIQDLIDKINNADEYITGAFKDGIINVIEAKKIESFLNSLALAKTEFDKRYDEIYANAKLSPTTKTNLATQKTTTDSAYSTLITLIQTVGEDKKASEEERVAVDEAFIEYKNELALLTTLLEKANKEITDGLDTRITTAESSITQNTNEIALRVKETTYLTGLDQTKQEAKAYTDAAIDPLQDQLNETNEYVDGAFKDGIIYDSEYRKIQGYLNTLQTNKAELDQKYNQVYNNPNLTGTPKANLSTAKTNYNSSYNNLISAINVAIADQKTTPEESADVDAKFVNFRNALGVLASAFEDAVSAAGISYTDGQITPIDNRLTTAESSIIQNANQIALKVSETDYNGNTIASLINQSATTIQILASKINLIGQVSFSSLDEATKTQVDNNLVTTQQLIQNSTFKNGSSNAWTAFQTPSWSVDTTTLFEGVNTAKNERSGETSAFLRNAYTNYTPASEGMYFTFSGYIKTDNFTGIDGDVYADTRFYNDSSSTALQDEAIIITPNKNNAWVKWSITTQAPAGSTRLRVGLVTSKNGRIWIGKPMLQIGQNATPHQEYSYSGQWSYRGTTEIDGASIRTGTISFDQAFGGKISLGGVNYGNGELVMYDDAGEQQVLITATDRVFDEMTVGKVSSAYIMTRNPEMASIYYVDPVAGNDEADGRSLTTPFQTVQRAIDQLPDSLNKNVTIQVLSNKGLFSENIYVNGVGGNGIPFLDFGGFNNTLQGYIWVTSCPTQVVIQNMIAVYPFMTPPSASYNGVVSNFYSQLVNVNNCQIYGRNRAVNAVKTYAGGKTYVNTVDLYDCTYGVSAERASSVNAHNTAGQGLSNWAYADGSWVIGSGSRPNFTSRIINNGQIAETGTTPATTATGRGYLPPGSPGAGKTQFTKTYTANGGDSWRTNFNAWRNDNKVMQGEWGNYGLHRGYWFFGAGLSADLTGADIKSMKLTVRRQTQHGYGNANVTFRWHSLTVDPGANNTQPSVSNGSFQAVFGQGQTRTLNIPSSFWNDFKTGNAKGLGIYTGTNLQKDYAIFDPTATLEVVYEK